MYLNQQEYLLNRVKTKNWRKTRKITILGELVSNYQKIKNDIKLN